MTTEFSKKTLALHNNYRTRHGAPPLEWSDELEKAAKEHASALLFQQNDPSLTPKQGVLWGQNLFEYEAEGCGQVTDDEAIEDAVHTWYEDSANYDPKNPSASKGGNFSQLIWSSSQRVGAGIAKKEEGGATAIVVIAFYDPPANRQGQFESNVSVQNLTSSMRSNTTTSATTTTSSSSSSTQQSTQKSESSQQNVSSTTSSTSAQNTNNQKSHTTTSGDTTIEIRDQNLLQNLDSSTQNQNQQQRQINVTTTTEISDDQKTAQNLNLDGGNEASTQKIVTTKTTTTFIADGGQGQDLVSDEQQSSADQNQTVDTTTGQNTSSIATKKVTTTTTTTTVKGSTTTDGDSGSVQLATEPAATEATSNEIDLASNAAASKKITTTKTVTTTTVKGTTMDDGSPDPVGQIQNDPEPIVELAPETVSADDDSTERKIITTVETADQKSTVSDNRQDLTSTSTTEFSTGQNLTTAKVTKTVTTTTVKEGSSTSTGTEEGEIDLTSQINRDQIVPTQVPAQVSVDQNLSQSGGQNSTSTTKKVTTVTTVKGTTTASGQDTDGRDLMAAVRDLIPAASAAGLDVNTTTKTDVQQIGSADQNLTGTKKVVTTTTTIKGSGEEAENLVSVLQNLVPMTTATNDLSTKVTTTTKTTSSKTTQGTTDLVDQSGHQDLANVDHLRENQVNSTTERRDSSSVTDQAQTRQVTSTTSTKTVVQKGSTSGVTPPSLPDCFNPVTGQQSKTTATTTITKRTMTTMTTDDGGNHGNDTVLIEPVSESHTTSTRKVTTIDASQQQQQEQQAIETAKTAVTSTNTTTIQTAATRQTTILTTETLNVAVRLHNELRARHGAPAVTVDQELCKEAQTYAKSIVSQETTTIEKSEKRLNVGQNIYRLSGPLVDPSEAIRQAVDVWYSKVTEYNWDKPLNSGPGYQLFSQLVWKSVKTIGVGVETEGTKTVICILYSPPGNIVSEERFKENVQPAQS